MVKVNEIIKSNIFIYCDQIQIHGKINENIYILTQFIGHNCWYFEKHHNKTCNNCNKFMHEGGV